MSFDIGIMLFFLGLILIVMVILIYLFYHSFSLFGNLMGDIKIERNKLNAIS